jgi:hypothetical protein
LLLSALHVAQAVTGTLSRGVEQFQMALRRGPDLVSRVRQEWTVRLDTLYDKLLLRPGVASNATARFSQSDIKHLSDWVQGAPFHVSFEQSATFCRYFGTPMLLYQLFTTTVECLKLGAAKDGPALTVPDVLAALKDAGLVHEDACPTFFVDQHSSAGEYVQAPLKVLVFHLTRVFVKLVGETPSFVLPFENIRDE